MHAFFKRFISLCLVLATAVLGFSGCVESDFSSDNIMTAPKVSAVQQSIYNILGTDSESVSLVYPQNGDYRSAIIMCDFTGDGYQDAIGFTMRNDDSAVTVNFMTEIGGVWTLISTFKSSTNQVDKVLFGDVTGDGVTDVVIGWGSAKGLANSAGLYYYEDGTVKGFSLGHSYTEIELMDLDNGGAKDIFTVSVATLVSAASVETGNSMANLYSFDNDALVCTHRCVLYNNISSFSGISLGKSVDGRTCVTVDGIMADGSMITQLLYINPFSGKMLSPLSFAGVYETYNYFYRAPQVALTSRDVDGDGIIEMPICIYENDEEKKIYSTDYVIEWVKFDIAARVATSVVKVQIYNREDNYTVDIPESEKDFIRCRRDSKTDTASFYLCEFNDYGKVTNETELFKIKVFTAETWNNLPKEDTPNSLTEKRSYRKDDYVFLKSAKLDGADVVYAANVETYNTLYSTIPYSLETVD